MERNFSTIAIASLLFAVVLFGGYSCSDDDPYYGDYLTEAQVRRMIEDALRENNQQLEFTKWKILPYTVLKEHWDWNEDRGRYEAIYDLPELSKFIYEEGANLGYVFIGQQDKDEVQKLLPYIDTYPGTDEDGNIITYTETISYDIQYAPNEESTVAFFIQASDLIREDAYLVDYNFRIVLIW